MPIHILSNLPTQETELVRPPVPSPASHCVICQKSLDEVGGKRIVAQQLRGVIISKEYRGGGNPDYPYRSFKISPTPLYLTVWGEMSMWPEDAIQRAVDDFQKGKASWFCQICGKRACSVCGAPINYPMGSDILNDNGSSSHCGIMPFNPGCINPRCKNFKEWDHG